MQILLGDEDVKNSYFFLYICKMGLEFSQSCL